MNIHSVQAQIGLGEDSTRQFKADVSNAESLSSEMAAFANSEGGTIYLGVADNGTTPGLDIADVSRINQLISNAASQLVKSPLTVRTENVALKNGKIVIVLTVPKGLDKPYFDKNGVIWLKIGADKRRVNSKEELRRLFQLTDQFHADELPTRAGIDRLDKLRFRDFLRDVYKRSFPDEIKELTRLLQNMNLATDDAMLNLAGLLLFAERPELVKPLFVVKAIRYPGNEIHATNYVDTEDFSGPLSKIFEDALAFILRNLHKIQAGRDVNAPGRSEIPIGVFEELLVNALVHRDYMVSAPIRLFIFDNRIEIISPGHLPDNLTVEKIRTGISNIRNPILVSYAAKGLLPYHGLGSGIKRALEEWSQINFTDDRDGGQFTATVFRKTMEELGIFDKNAIECVAQTYLNRMLIQYMHNQAIIYPIYCMCTDSDYFYATHSIDMQIKGQTDPINDLLNAIRANPSIDYMSLAHALGVSEATVKRNIQKLKQQIRLHRIGSRKTGHWDVVE